MNLDHVPTPMSITELQGLAEAVKIRMPGWTLNVFSDPFGEGARAQFNGPVPDADDPLGEPRVLNVIAPIPPQWHADFFWRWLLWRWQQILLHEACELFWVDGKAYRDPHDPVVVTL